MITADPTKSSLPKTPPLAQARSSCQRLSPVATAPVPDAMATGDIYGNLVRLQRELKQVKHSGAIDEPG